MKLSQSAPQQTHRVLEYGPPKSGKTKLAGALSSDFNLLWFDIENGSNTLRSLPIEQQDRINLIQLPDTRSYPIAIETLLKVIKGGPVKICHQHGKVSCLECNKAGALFEQVNLSTIGPDTIVVFDSLTQLTNSAIAHITKNQDDTYKLNYDDWGNLGKIMDIFLSHIQQASYNVICISHETEAEQEDGKNKIVPVAGTRNFSRNVAKYFDHVVYCEVSAKKHKFTSMSTSNLNIVTGSRTDISIDKMETPSLLPIFQATGPGPRKVQAEQAVENIATLVQVANEITMAAIQDTKVIENKMQQTEAPKESLMQRIKRQQAEAAAKAVQS